MTGQWAGGPVMGEWQQWNGTPGFLPKSWETCRILSHVTISALGSSISPSLRVNQGPDRLYYFKNIQKTRLDPIWPVHMISSSFRTSLTGPEPTSVLTSYILTSTYVLTTCN
jgi:hypothetical protein